MKHTLTLRGVSSSSDIAARFNTTNFTTFADVDKPPFEVTETGYALSCFVSFFLNYHSRQMGRV